jgi:hypothetical protein
VAGGGGLAFVVALLQAGARQVRGERLARLLVVAGCVGADKRSNHLILPPVSRQAWALEFRCLLGDIDD